jgi:ABC-type spermidine/putrescine transport system permease subunit I
MAAQARGRRSLRKSETSLGLLAPLAILYGGFALVPFGLILRQSFDGGFGNFRTVLASPLLLRVAGNTVLIGAITTVVTLLLATVVAAALWRSSPTVHRVILAFVLLPFWTAVLVKNFAWAALLQDNGVANTILSALGLGPFTLLHNRFAVVVGMVHYALPYATFPIYTAMRGIDAKVERAARSLGATTSSVTRHIILPMIMPGVAAAALLVFTVSAGFFITPVLLGAPSDMMISNLVDYYVHELGQFENAAAVAVLILLALTPLIVIQQFLAERGQHGLA